MVEMLSDGRERLHVLFFYPLPVVGTIGGVLRGSGQNSIFATHVYMWRCGHLSAPRNCGAVGSSSESHVEGQSEGALAGGTLAGGGKGGGALSSTKGGLASLHKLLGSATAAAQAERDVARVRLKLPADATWCTAALREEQPTPTAVSKGALARPEPALCSLYVLTERGDFFRYSIDPVNGTSTLQDERRLLDANS